MTRQFTWNKKEKLKSRKRIERVFKEGKGLTLFPFKVLWLLEPAAGPASVADKTQTAISPLQAGFGVSSRNFSKAVDRNRIKRLSREAFRLQKQPLFQRLKEKGLCLAVFFIYTGKDLPDYATVTHKIGVALQKLIKEIS
ncbi:MAG TPA: ribonuclease P protein component [Puia sp.]|nr:ribonuclease P protein component [Puia sp.]